MEAEEAPPPDTLNARPLKEPTAVVAANLTQTVVNDTEPLVEVKVNVEVKPVEFENEISNPVGAVSDKSPVSEAPETVKDCTVDAVPQVVEKADAKVLGETVITGLAGAAGVPAIELDAAPFPALFTARI